MTSVSFFMIRQQSWMLAAIEGGKSLIKKVKNQMLKFLTRDFLSTSCSEIVYILIFNLLLIVNQ